MAKGKHSAALFEVINSTKRPESIAQSLRTPKWWFKGRQTPGSAAPAEPPSFDEPATPVASAPDPTAAPRASTMRSMPPASTAGRSSAVHLDFNRERQELTLRLRYTTALVSSFFLCAAIGGAYVIGRHLNHGPQSALASTQPPAQAPQYLRQAPQAGVTDVTRQRLVRPAVNTGMAQARRPQPEQTSTPAQARPAVASLVPASATTSLPRMIGLNYAIIQTYPDSEREAAEAACAFLNKNGIPCTLEKTDYVKNPNWVCLVGTAGFTKISSGDYVTYVDHIIALAEKFPTARFYRFNPKAFKWRG
jgi:hypothetical protein